MRKILYILLILILAGTGQGYRGSRPDFTNFSSMFLSLDGGTMAGDIDMDGYDILNMDDLTLNSITGSFSWKGDDIALNMSSGRKRFNLKDDVTNAFKISVGPSFLNYINIDTDTGFEAITFGNPTDDQTFVFDGDGPFTKSGTGATTFGGPLESTTINTGSGARELDQDVISGSSPTFDGTNFTGVPLATTVTTNANLTGIVTSTGNATAIANKAIAIAKLADGTDGEIITWDASGVIDTVSVGTATHVLTSNGTGQPPTFQAGGGNPSFETGDIGYWSLVSADIIAKNIYPEPTDAYDTYNAGDFNLYTIFVQYWRTRDNSFAYAAVHLPHGVTITDAIVYGNGATGQSWSLIRCKIDDNSTQSSLASAVYRTGVSSIGSVVDNSQFQYILSLGLSAEGGQTNEVFGGYVKFTYP